MIAARVENIRTNFDRYRAATFAITLIGYLAVTPVILDRLSPLTGDEPFYVMTAISLVRDRNLDETDNYARRDYHEFYPDDPLPEGWNGWPSFPRTLPPHPAVTEREGLYTKHGLGLSVLIAIPYELLGRVGAMLVVVLSAALLATNMYLLGTESGTRRLAAMLVAVGLALTLPIAPYALLLFPEVPAALMLIYSVRRITSPSNNLLQWAVSGSAIAMLPWLHQRFAPTAAVLGLMLGIRAIRNRDAWIAMSGGIPIVLGALTIISYNMWLYGTPMQNTGDHAGFSDGPGTVNGLFGLLLDAQWGLLIAAPVYALALVGVPFWIRAHRWTALTAVAAVIPYIAVVASYQVWWGEWGPPARYLVPVAPLAAAPICCLWRRYSLPGRILVSLVAIPGAVLTLVALGDPQRMYHHPDGHNKLVGRFGEIMSVDLASHLVAFQPLAQDALPARVLASVIMVGVIALIAVWTYVGTGGRSNEA
jgi:hypothetical protein